MDKPDFSRYLEYIGPNAQNKSGRSRKFWGVEVRGRVVTRHWGRIGTAGQKKTESFFTAAMAIKKARALVDSKWAEGYRLDIDVVTALASLLA